MTEDQDDRMIFTFIRESSVYLRVLVLLCWFTVGCDRTPATKKQSTAQSVSQSEKALKDSPSDDEQSESNFKTAALGFEDVPEVDASEISGDQLVNLYGYYKVKSGDTLSKIATTHGIDLKAILRLNDLSANKPIQPGQLIYLPSDG